MSHHEMTASEIQKHVRIYIMVFAALLFLTGLTVGVFYLHLPIVWAVIVALLVASVKGSLVACYFMHLISERALFLWMVFALCAILFTALLFLPAVTTHESVGV